MTPYTFATWRADHRGQRFFAIRAAYADLYGAWHPRSYKWEGWLADLAYYLRCRVWTRYNTVHLRTLPPTWTDADTRLLHAAFTILVDFVEQEEPFARTLIEHDAACPRPGMDLEGVCHSCQVDESQLAFGTELRALYHWWTVERPTNRAAEDRALAAWHEAFTAQGGFSAPDTATTIQRKDVHTVWERDNDAQDTAMLIRLIQIRGSLWT